MSCGQIQERFELSLVNFHYTLRSCGSYVFGLENFFFSYFVAFVGREGLYQF